MNLRDLAQNIISGGKKLQQATVVNPDQNKFLNLASEELGIRTLNAIKKAYPVGLERTNQILTELKGLFQ